MSGGRVILFGKLPSHGDFVARGLAEVARRAWDDWLSVGLERAGARLGKEFTVTHETAPPWRFVAGPGAFGPCWRAGALAPSVDSVGRRFFIMTAIDGLAGGPAAGRGPALAEAMEGLIHRAFEQNLDADALVLAAEDRLFAEEEEAPADISIRPREMWWVEPVRGLRPVVFDHAPRDPLSEPSMVARETVR